MLRVQVGNRQRNIGLGCASDLTLAEARDKARELRKVARAGGDPTACQKARAPGCLERHGKSFLTTPTQHAFPRYCPKWHMQER